MNMVEVETISIVIASIGVLVGVTISIMELKNIVKARQAELFMNLYDHYNDAEFVRRWGTVIYQFDWKDFDDWKKKYGPETNIEAYSSFAALGNYFKGVGVLLNKKLIDMSLVENLISPAALRYWEKYEPVIKGFREHYKFPEAWNWVEYLYSELKKRETQLTTATR